jgi:hypothetical protein
MQSHGRNPMSDLHIFSLTWFNHLHITCWTSEPSHFPGATLKTSYLIHILEALPELRRSKIIQSLSDSVWATCYRDAEPLSKGLNSNAWVTLLRIPGCNVSGINSRELWAASRWPTSPRWHWGYSSKHFSYRGRRSPYSSHRDQMIVGISHDLRLSVEGMINGEQHRNITDLESILSL